MNWAILQSGVGVDIQGADFRAVCIKRQFRRMRIVDGLAISDYRSRTPQECGRLYAEFLKRNGLQLPWTVAVLPRSAVLLRSLTFPRGVESELRSAVQFQIDSLHPFEEGAVYWDVSPAPSAAEMATPAASRVEAPVLIAEKSYIDATAGWFRDAGIGVSQFSATTTVLVAVISSQIKSAFVCVNLNGDTAELIGCVPGAALLSREIQIREIHIDDAAMLRRELERMHSELRLPEGSRPPLIVCGDSAGEFRNALSSDLPVIVIEAPEAFPPTVFENEHPRLDSDSVAVAAAILAVDRDRPFSLNLLPAESRSYRSPLTYLPAYVLSAAVVLLALALGVRGTFQDWQYQRYLNREIQALQPQIAAAQSADDQSREAYQRVALLRNLRRTVVLPLEMLNSLTVALPDDVWLENVQFDGTTLTMSGYASSASQLLQTLAASAYFETPQFLSPVRRNQDGKDIFRIGMRLRAAGNS
jgi:Tfp pilus assembly protein PilN